MKCKAKRIRKGCYEYRGYIIQSVGYYEPEHRVCWEAHLPDVICADYHGYTLREIKLLIDEDSKRKNKNDCRRA